jgi:hypothetical protein
MSLKWFIPSIVFGRGIGVVTIVFGLSLVPFDKFTSIWHWIGFILLCALLIMAVFFFATKFNKYLENKNKKEEAEKEVEEEEDKTQIYLNDQNAEILIDEERYTDGTNSPTRHTEYACPCGKGKIVYESVVGFSDFYAFFECDKCEKKYKLVTAQEHLWEIKKK